MSGPLDDDELPAAGLRDALPMTRNSDVATTLGASVALGMLPLVGSALSTSFQSLVQAVNQRELEAWLARLSECVDVMASRLGIPVDEIVGDGQWYESMVRGSRAAQETRSSAKLDMLESGISNSGSWTGRSALLERTLMKLLIQLEPEQLTVLRVFNDPVGVQAAWSGLPFDFTLADLYLGTAGGSISSLTDVVARQLSELYSSGLTEAGYGPDFAPVQNESQHFRLTPLGRELLLYCDSRHFDIG